MWPFTKKKNEEPKIDDNAFLNQILRFVKNYGAINSTYDDEQFVKNGYGGNADVYAIINYIITTASNVPLILEKRQADGTWKPEKSNLMDLINNPNPSSGYSLFIEELLGWKLLTGNGYVYAPIIQDGVNKGKTLEMWVMPSAGMEVIGGGATKIVKGYTYNGWDDELIAPGNVMHLRYFNPMGAIAGDSRNIFMGQSPLKAGELVIKKSNTGALSEVTAFANNGAIGVFSRDGNDGSFSELQSEQLNSKWRKMAGGAKNKNSIVHTPANVKYHKIGESPADLKIIESGLAAKRQLASLLKMPTQLLNDPDGTTFNNQAEAQKSLYTNVIIPEIRGIGEGLVRWLGEAYHPGENIRIVPNTSDIEVLQANKKEQAEWLSKAYWLKGSEKRAIMGLDADEAINDYYIPTSLIPMSDVGAVDEDELRQRIADAREGAE